MPSFERTFALHVPSSTENLTIIRDFVSSIAAQAGLDDRESARLALAVDEACANVIEHAYRSEPLHEVTVRAVVDDDEIKFEVIDTGQGFAPGEMSEMGIEELIRQRKSGGLGLRLIRAMMDDVQYRIIPGEKNELRMIKKLHKH